MFPDTTMSPPNTATPSPDFFPPDDPDIKTLTSVPKCFPRKNLLTGLIHKKKLD